MIEIALLNRPLLRPGSPPAFAAAFAIAAAATLTRWALMPLFAHLPFGGMPYAAAFFGIVTTTFLCGAAAGIAGMFASVAATWALVLMPHMTLLAPFQTLAFVVGASTMIAIIATMRLASDKMQRINENLRSSEAQLVEASKAKSEFIARMSHELRTPLNAIIGFSEMIREAMIGPLDARYRGYGADIHNAGRHLQNIINDILDISKIEGGGRLELHDEPVSIGDMIESCRRIVAAMAETTGVALSVDVPASLPLIRCDALRLRQILLNLMSNAVKFTPAGGAATVSAAVEDGFALVTVADNGIGMRAEDIALALEPFCQLSGAGDALTRRFAGTGLGLPVAKALVELHGGTLAIESAPQRGTTVRIRLPLERGAAVAA